MKDLDFDELDKAVSSLMGSVPKTTTPPTGDDGIQEKVLTIKESQPRPSSNDTLLTPAPTPAPEALKPASATKKAGQFMDVVHPSSDMRSRPSSSSRVGVTITPRADVSLLPERETTENRPTDGVAPEVPEKKAVWPDPLELAATPSPKEEPAPLEDEKDDTAVPVPPVSSSVDLSTPLEQILGSPFLTDAKVEKRPLGSEPPTGGDAPAEQMENVEEPAVIPKQDKVTDEPPIQPVQAELDSDLIAIESNEPTAASEKPVASSESVKPPFDHRLTDHSKSTSTGPTSITQQYKEQTSTGDQTHAAIYDASTYTEPPLAHPAKKKAGWLWVVWVVLLLAVGAGGAVALWLMGVI